MQIVARHILHDATAAFRYHALAGHKFHTKAKIPHSTVEVAQRRAGICGYNAADSGAIGERNSQRKKLILFRQNTQQFLDPHTRLHSECKIVWIVGEDSIHAREIERDVIARRGRADAQFRAAAAGNYSKFFRCGKADDFGDLCNFRGLNDGRGTLRIDLTRSKFRRIGENVRAAYNFFETRDGSLRGTAHAGMVVETGIGCTRISPHALPSGSTLPGFNRSAGLNAARTRRIKSRSSGVNISGMSSFFSMPTPCSPVSAPPTATQCFIISRPAATTRLNCSGSRSSNRMRGCRLPSPA